MEQITLGEIAVALTFVVGFVSSIGYLKKNLVDWMGAAVGKELKPLSERMSALEERMTEVDKESTKNFLVARITEVERGDERSEFARQRFSEQYDHYIKGGGNSYIKDRVEKLKGEGKI